MYLEEMLTICKKFNEIYGTYLCDIYIFQMVLSYEMKTQHDSQDNF